MITLKLLLISPRRTVCVCNILEMLHSNIVWGNGDDYVCFFRNDFLCFSEMKNISVYKEIIITTVLDICLPEEHRRSLPIYVKSFWTFFFSCTRAESDYISLQLVSSYVNSPLVTISLHISTNKHFPELKYNH